MAKLNHPVVHLTTFAVAKAAVVPGHLALVQCVAAIAVRLDLHAVSDHAAVLRAQVVDLAVAVVPAAASCEPAVAKQV